MQKFIEEFPILKQYTYANTAGTGLIYDSLLEWRQGHDIDYLVGGSIMKMKSVQMITAAKEGLSAFFSCKQDNVALVPNFSLGLNMLADSLDRSKTILLLEQDYPSVNWPFEDRGFKVHYAKVAANLEDNIKAALERTKTDVLALSVIQWVNGIKIDLAFLKTLKETYHNLLIIADGTQFCGTDEFNFEASGLDVLGASAYKWMLSGYGNGFLLFKDWAKQHFNIKTIGFYAANGDKEKRDQVRFTKHFEPGHLDTLNFGSLKFSIDFLSSIGIQRIANQNRKLAAKAKSIFAAMDLLEDAVVSRTVHSTIFNIKGDNIRFQKCAEADIVCAQRGDGIRFSFHFYNTENDIDRIAEVLKTTL